MFDGQRLDNTAVYKKANSRKGQRKLKRTSEGWKHSRNAKIKRVEVEDGAVSKSARRGTSPPRRRPFKSGNSGKKANSEDSSQFAMSSSERFSDDAIERTAYETSETSVQGSNIAVLQHLSTTGETASTNSTTISIPSSNYGVEQVNNDQTYRYASEVEPVQVVPAPRKRKSAHLHIAELCPQYRADLSVIVTVEVRLWGRCSGRLKTLVSTMLSNEQPPLPLTLGLKIRDQGRNTFQEVAPNKIRNYLGILPFSPPELDVRKRAGKFIFLLANTSPSEELEFAITMGLSDTSLECKAANLMPIRVARSRRSISAVANTLLESYRALGNCDIAEFTEESCQLPRDFSLDIARGIRSHENITRNRSTGRLSSSHVVALRTRGLTPQFMSELKDDNGRLPLELTLKDPCDEIGIYAENPVLDLSQRETRVLFNIARTSACTKRSFKVCFKIVGSMCKVESPEVELNYEQTEVVASHYIKGGVLYFYREKWTFEDYVQQLNSIDANTTPLESVTQVRNSICDLGDIDIRPLPDETACGEFVQKVARDLELDLASLQKWMSNATNNVDCKKWARDTFRYWLVTNNYRLDQGELDFSTVRSAQFNIRYQIKRLLEREGLSVDAIARKAHLSYPFALGRWFSEVDTRSVILTTTSAELGVWLHRLYMNKQPLAPIERPEEKCQRRTSPIRVLSAYYSTTEGKAAEQRWKTAAADYSVYLDNLCKQEDELFYDLLLIEEAIKSGTVNTRAPPMMGVKEKPRSTSKSYDLHRKPDTNSVRFPNVRELRGYEESSRRIRGLIEKNPRLTKCLTNRCSSTNANTNEMVSSCTLDDLIEASMVLLQWKCPLSH